MNPIVLRLYENGEGKALNLLSSSLLPPQYNIPPFFNELLMRAVAASAIAFLLSFAASTWAYSILAPNAEHGWFNLGAQR